MVGHQVRVRSRNVVVSKDAVEVDGNASRRSSRGGLRGDDVLNQVGRRFWCVFPLGSQASRKVVEHVLKIHEEVILA